MPPTLQSPTQFLLSMVGPSTMAETLQDYEQWWFAEGMEISAAHDRAGTPWLKMFDLQGRRIDELQYAPSYWIMLRKGYKAGAVWRAIENNTLLEPFQIGYVTSFFDAGLYCPHTVSISTATPLAKYGSQAVKDRFLTPMLRKDDTVWQGATWFTEARGGSDLGANVDTIARQDGDRWLLNGDKYFTSNAIAEVAVVAARIEGATHGIKGLALFLTPKRKDNGDLNFFIRRIKDKIATRSVPTGEIELRDSEAYLLGKPEWGIYQILEVLNLSRVCNCMGAVALAQRAYADAYQFASERIAFGKPLIEQPLMKHQFEARANELRGLFAMAWESAKLLNSVYQETPPYSERFHLFRLLVHLAKYWTAERAVQFSKWCMEVHGGMGTLAEFGVERWLREAMILAIWEGPPHRQMLDGLECMERKHAHMLLFDWLAQWTTEASRSEMRARVEQHLALPADEKEARVQELFDTLSAYVATSLGNRST